MKQAFAGALLAAVVFTAAGFAYSSTRPNAVTPGQFNALKKRVTKLEKDDRAVVGYLGACLLHWQGVSENGNPSSNIGFLYSADGSTIAIRTGLDFPLPGQAVSLYVPATTDVSCTTSGAFAHIHYTRATLNGSLQKLSHVPFALK